MNQAELNRIDQASARQATENSSLKSSRPVRLIHIVGDSKWGGGGTIILALADLGRRMGWQVDMLTTDPFTQQIARNHGMGVVDLDVIWREIRPFKDTAGLLKLARFLRKSEYDIVHTHTSKAGFVGRVAAKLAGVPGIIHTVHGFAFHEASSRRSLLVYSFLERVAAYFCHYMVTVSNYHRDWAVSLGIGNKKKLLAIPNGIDPALLKLTTSRQKVRAEWGVTDEDVVLLSTGRLAAQKGLIYLLEALPRVIREAPVPVKVILAGDGPLREELEQASQRLQLQSQVKFLGFREDIRDLLNACDLVVLPSLYEGLSISLLEAMAAGKPIVSTTIGSNLEVTRNGAAAILVPPKDVDALADSLLKCLKNPEEGLAKAKVGNDVFFSNYTVEKMLEGYQSVYEKLSLKGNRARGGAVSLAPIKN